MTLTKRILIAMGAGLVFGLILHVLIQGEGKVAVIAQQWIVSGVLDTLGTIFVNLLKLLVVPLVFVSLVLGTLALGNNARVGIMAGKTIGLYLLTTCIAISLALTLAILVGPGNGVSLDSATEFSGAAAPSLKQVLIDIFPTNPIAAMANGNMLQVIVFSLLTGFALCQVGEKGQATRDFFESFDAVVMRMVFILMAIAPIGVFALIAEMVAELGFELLSALAKYMLTLAGALLLHLIIVYCGLIRSFGGLNPITFLLNMRPAMLVAFSTASSSATLPITLRTVENRVGVDNSVASFVLPLGATINMDGTAIMQGVATAFIAQAFGIDLTLGQYLTVILTATLASIGTAGVPGVGMIMLSMVLTQVGLPVEGIALVLGVDRILDMLRTAVNITGDAAVATLVAKSEGHFDEAIFNETSDSQV